LKKGFVKWTAILIVIALLAGSIVTIAFSVFR
jgi:cytochrome c oxidase subunit IV